MKTIPQDLGRNSSKDGQAHEGGVLGSKEVRGVFSLAVTCPARIQRQMEVKYKSQRLSR